MDAERNAARRDDVERVITMMFRASHRAVIALFVLCGLVPLPVVALESGATAGTTHLRTGIWAVAPVSDPAVPTTGTPMVINSLSTKKNSYFWVRNVGDFDLQSFIIGQSVSATGRSPAVEIRACSGVWDTTKDTCTGTISVLLTTGDGQSGSAVVPLPLGVGAAVQLAAYPTKNGMTTSISTSVQRQSIRAALQFSG